MGWGLNSKWYCVIPHWTKHALKFIRIEDTNTAKKKKITTEYCHIWLFLEDTNIWGGVWIQRNHIWPASKNIHGDKKKNENKNSKQSVKNYLRLSFNLRNVKKKTAVVEREKDNKRELNV